MITLFHIPGSCSTAVKRVLDKIQLSYQIKEEALDQKSQALLQANPLGKVPTLIIGDQVLTEGMAILSWLAEKYPEAELMPPAASIDNAHAKRWLAFVYATLHPTWILFFHAAKYGEQVEAIKAKAENDIHQYFAIIEKQLEKHNFIAGNKMTLTDYYLLATLDWGGMLTLPLFTHYPVLLAYKQRMEKQQETAQQPTAA